MGESVWTGRLPGDASFGADVKHAARLFSVKPPSGTNVAVFP